MSESKNKKGKHSDSSLSESARRLGEVGGRKGGPARAKALSAEERSAIAREGGKAKAAKAKTLAKKAKRSKGGK